MDTNVGEMPLDIFSDYISDILDEEWSWEYLVIVTYSFTHCILESEMGCGTRYTEKSCAGRFYGYGTGRGESHGNGETYNTGNGNYLRLWA
jgi:hypothetical protein